MSSTTETTAVRTAGAARRWIRALTVAGALATALAVWVVADPLAGADLAVAQGDGTQHVGPAAVVLAGVVALSRAPSARV